ncbi:hypothetical protein CU098_000625, partial [Rhizopus stolonifer]
MALALVHGHPRPHSPRAGASIFKSTETFSRAGVILTAKPECLKIDQEYQHNSSSRNKSLFPTSSESFQEIWIDGNVTQWAQAAKQAQAGGVSLEHDLYEKTVNAALRVLPILQKEYTLLPVGVCNRVEVYKNNSTATIAHSSLVPSSGVSHSSATA